MNQNGACFCQCPTGYTGTTCESQDICNVRNPCICGTCQNDATNPLGFKCMTLILVS